jgi:glycosyltransferase involved in cell wall biosynthesis
MTIGVLICTYQRPNDLARLLSALAQQERRADDVIVVARGDDAPSLAVLACALRDPQGLSLRVIHVTQAGLVHARNAGLDACRTDILAMTDDDTVPHTDWLRRILAHFMADAELGGLGGRDWCHDGHQFDEGRRRVVGRLSWFGSMVGNHHLGYGPPRLVDFIKGANMSYRAAAFQHVRFDHRLRGTGVQPLEDTAFPVAIRVCGWKLLYDPLVAVDHYAGQRDQARLYVGVTDVRDIEGYFDLGYNEVIAIWQLLTPAGRVAYILWSFLIGRSISPGLLQALRFTWRIGAMSWRRFWAVQRGKAAAYRVMWFGQVPLFPTPEVADETKTLFSRCLLTLWSFGRMGGRKI